MLTANHFIILFLATFIGSCGVANTETRLMTASAKVQPTPREEIFQNNSGRLININGWQIPMPDEKKSDGERLTNGTMADGNKINVLISYYVPRKTFLYNLEIAPAFQDRIVTGVLKIESIGELKANNKIFGYTINARQANENQPGFGYRIYDADGDGKFETMVVDSSAFHIPDWTLKEK